MAPDTMVRDPTAPATYRFCPLAAADLPLVRRWLATPHVAQWWGDADEQFARVHNDFAEPAMAQYIVGDGDRPFGYLQCYDLAAWPEEAFGAQPPGTCAIDQFIGEPDMLARGHGSAFIRAFVAGLAASGTPRVITDPDPSNARAIRACEKAGFRRQRVVDTRSGPALLMVCNP